MKKLHRNIFIILLVGITSLPFTLPGYFYSLKQLHSWEMEERLEASSLTTIELRTGSIQWLKKGKELLINGEPFDVKKTETKGEFTKVIGLWDNKEKELKNIIEAFQSRHSHADNISSQILFLCWYPFKVPPITLALPQVNRNFVSYYQLKLFKGFYKLATPPPQANTFTS